MTLYHKSEIPNIGFLATIIVSGDILIGFNFNEMGQFSFLVQPFGYGIVFREGTHFGRLVWCAHVIELTIMPVIWKKQNRRIE